MRPDLPHTRRSCRVLLFIIGLLLVSLAAPQSLAQGSGKNRVEKDGMIVEVAELTRAATANGAAQEDCIGPGSVINGGFSIQNGAITPVSVTAQVSLPGGLLAIPGSCVANIGSCSVVNPSTISYTATIPVGETAQVSFVLQVGNLVLPETTLCLLLTLTLGSAPPFTVESCVTATCPLAGPGLPFAGLNDPSDQKAGSVLVYNLYSSNPTQPGSSNSRINITNTEPSRSVAVHLFFVDGNTCSITDRYICLTPNQTMTFLASEQDPGITGYLIAVATEVRLGCPITFNYLIGDAFIKLPTGHAANLGAEAISGIAGGIPLCNVNSVTARLNFDGISYGLVGRVLASSSIPSRGDGNDTLIVLNSMAGQLTTGLFNIGPIFGIVYDDAEHPHSFSLSAACQFRASLSNAIPRLTPRFETVIPAGQTGWMKLWGTTEVPMLGAQINFNPNSGSSGGAYSQGHNLHKRTLAASGFLIVPIFPPNC